MIVSLLLGVPQLLAQACSIDLGSDHTICDGQSVTLTAPPGYPDYLWSTGSTGTSITVNSAGTYWGEVSYPTGELATNGNFSAGNTGFASQFNYNSTLTTDGNYWIGNNAFTFHPQLQGTGNGPFLMVNAGWMHAGWTPWCQTITVCPGQTYTFSVRLMSLASQGPPILDWTVDGTSLNQPMQTGAQATWGTFTRTWTSGPTQTSATICLLIGSGHGVGNDVGIDDISISSTIRLRDHVDVTVTPLPDFDLGPNATMCAGQNLVLDAGVPGGTYVWQDGSGLPNYVVSGPGVYSVTVTANGCPRSDLIAVSYDPLPVVDLGGDLVLCDGASVTLSPGVPGAHLWQDGSTGTSYTVTGPGTYSVRVTVNNCSATDVVDVSYTPNPVIDLGADVVACVGETVTLDATTPGATYVWSDGSVQPTLDVTTDASPSVVITVNGCPATDGANVSFNPLPVIDLGPDRTVCPGVMVPLDATTPNATYLWQDGSTSATFEATDEGTYTVEVTVDGCMTIDAFTLSNFSLQTVDLGPDLTICQGQGVTIGATVPGATYTWSTGAVTNTIGVSTAGTYWVDVTLNGCVVRDEVEVFVTPLPNVDLGPDLSICPGTTTLLDATVPGATYVWSNGAATPTLTAGAGDWDVTVTLNNCSRSDEIHIDYWPDNTVDLGPDVTLCPGASLTLDATLVDATYLWQDGSTNATLTVTSGGTYSVQRTDVNGCINTDAITVTYAAPTAIDLGPDTALCQGESLVLDATVAGATYAWSNGAATPTITVTTSGTFSVVVTQGSCTVNDAVVVQVNALPPPVDLGNDTTLCPGATLVLDAYGPGLSYAWSTGASTPTITVSNGGNYSVTVTNAANCTATDLLAVTYATPGAVDLGPDLVLCQGEIATLDATMAGATYAWSNGATTPTIDVSSTGTFSVVITQGTCSVNDAVDVVVDPMPQANLGNDVTLCAGDQITLDATWPGATYVWSTGATTPTITVNSNGTYAVTVDLNGCTATDAVDVNVLSATALDIGPDATYCAGELATLDATTAGATYLWSTGATTPTIDITSTDTYSVEVFLGLCSVTDQTTITFNPTPQANLGNDVNLCAGDQITLDATWPGATYVWSTGATTPTITVNSNGTYAVTVDLNGCTATDAVDVNVLSATALDIGPDATYCVGELATLDATTAGATYLWSTGATTPTIDITSTDTYSVEVFLGLCSVTDQTTITFNPAPQANLGNDVTLCAGDQVTLDATWPGATYVWSTGATTPTITVNSNGTYAVTVDLNGCTATDAVDVNVLSATALDIGPDATYCAGELATLDATTAGATYLWSTGATTPTIDINSTDTYSVEVFLGLCSVTDQTTITFNPTPQVDLGGDRVLCGGETTVTLNATWPGASYAWSTGATTPTIDVTANGTYGVVVSLGDCSAQDEVLIDFGSFNYDLGPDVTLCPGEVLELGLDLPAGTSTWNEADLAPTFTVSSAGTTTLHFVNDSGCEVRDTIHVSYADTDQLDLGDDVTLCDGETLELDASLAGATYLWNDGLTTATRTVSTAGTYSVDVFVGTCSVSDAITIDYTQLPSVHLGPDRSICPGSSTTFDATTAGATYLWSDGSTTPSHTITTAGEVMITITVNGCTATDHAEVSLLDAPVAHLGNDTTICEGSSLVLNVDQPNTSFIWDNGSTSAQRMITQAGTYWVDASRNTCTERDSIVVDVFSPSTFNLGADRSICAGSSVEIGLVVPGGSYVWSTGANTPTITVSTAGEYAATITVGGCVAQDTIAVELIHVTPPDLGNDRRACEGQQVVLHAQGANVTWSTGATGPTLTVSTTGIYTATVDSLGCSASDHVFVDFTPMTTSIELGGDLSICPGSFAVLQASAIPGASYRWSNGVSGQYTTVASPGYYSVHATGLCIDARDSVLVVAEDCNTYVYVPNTFTPDGDGYNEVFLPVLAGPVDAYQLDIFDRWGERIHTTNDRFAGWEGTYNGVNAQVGVYVWKLHFRVLAPEGVRAEERIGHVTLLR